MIGCFVTGTDTGVGKTLASCALLHALARHHPRVVGMKAVAAGAEPDGLGGWSNEDTRALRAASTLIVPHALSNPVLLPDPVSPHIAAQRAGRVVTLAPIVSAYQQLATLADAVVVEGAGGWLVPLSDAPPDAVPASAAPALSIADLAVALQLPVVLVVGLKLGCLNHAMLTAMAIRAQGLTLAGWMVSRVDPAMLEPEANIAWLQRNLGAPLLADMPYQAQPDARRCTVQLPKEWQ
ncbi:dethiobiotin synthase [Comamonas sp. GB3 AK4-5]|uniref:dethiobiotin synthase n=1 Tax=Comamonas sp. GB3 AK4-5 TaxID=3231487 RepID=UPI00351E4B94